MRILRCSSLLVLCAFPLAAQRLEPGNPPSPKVFKSQVPKAGSLRVTHVSLYKNGVGFFEHEAQVSGNASVQLNLSSSQLNDVLQSMTAIDLGGGHIRGANYDSTAPLEQQLATLPFSLGEQPSQETLFAALRGAQVEVTGAGAPFTGRLLSVEIRSSAPEADNGTQPLVDKRFATVITSAGATRTVELNQRTAMRLLDAGLRADLDRYLQSLDRNRTEGLRHLVLTDRGEGRRTLQVSFLSEVPVWKSTYRVLFTSTENGVKAQNTSATVQGFSVVDNTTGEDWNDVRLSLIAGSPQSFLQPLSQPMYTRRPEVPIAANAQTTPQTHDSGEENAPPPGSASADLSSGSGGNPASLFGSPTGTGSAAGGPVVAASRPRTMNMMKDTGPPPPPVMVPHSAAAPMPELFEQQARLSTEARTTTSAFDDFFAYQLTDPVSIPRNGSALVPILQARLPAENVTLWSRNQASALRALWLTNTSGMTLDRGSFSVVENGSFAGEGLIDPLRPEEKRLLSYAVDRAVCVMPELDGSTWQIKHVSVAQGVLRAETVEVAQARYAIADAGAEGRTVLIEEPRRTDWTLDEEGLPPAETTASVYRFRVHVSAHGRAHLSISQRHTVEQAYSLVDNTEEQLKVYLQGNHADPDVLLQLQPVFAARRTMADLQARIQATETRIAALGSDQKRLRENLVSLKGSAEERALTKRYTGELNAQEDSLITLQAELERLQRQHTAAAGELDRLINTLHIA